MGKSLTFRSATSAIMDRIQWMRQVGISFRGMRDLYQVLGYPRQITGREYRDRYARGGVAGAIIDAIVDATWRGDMELIEDENPKTFTPFEKAWDELDTRLKASEVMKRADKLSRLSTYSVILIGAAGELSDELPRGNGKGSKGVIGLWPWYGGGGPGSGNNRRLDESMDSDATIQDYDTDPKSPRFALPFTYRLRRTEVVSPALQVPVHWSRIIHLAEGCLEDEVFGQPALERVWNLLDDLDKVTGGGAEAFWLRANQGLHIDIDKDMTIGDANTEKAALKEQAELYAHQQQRWLRTRGVNIETLGSDVANFNSPADAVLTQIAGAARIPKRILTGSEMGELASSQDRDNWKDQVNGRQSGYAGPYIVRRLVDRLVEYGYLPAPKNGPLAYEVKWPHIEVLTETEKAEGAAKWATTNQAQGSPVYGAAEIRDHWYGMEPLTPEQIKAEVEAKASMSKAGAPPAPVGNPNSQPGFLRAAEESEMLRVLSAAVEANNTEVIDRILGIRHATFDDSQPRDDHGRWTEGAPSFGEFDPSRAYLEAYKATGGLPSARLSGKQATKVHEALSHLERMLNDPEVGLPIWSALGGGVSLQDIRDKILDLEAGRAEFVGGKGPRPEGKINTMYGPAPLQMRTGAVDKLYEALMAIRKLLEDPDTSDATLRFLKAVADAGGLDQFKAKLVNEGARAKP